MFASVLIFLDGSPASQAALTTGVAVGKAASARIKAVFIEDERRFMHFPPMTTMSAAIGAAPALPVPLPAEEMAAMESQIADEREATEKLFSDECERAGMKGVFLAVRGDILEEMQRHAHIADLVVVGVRGSADDGHTDPGEKIEPLLRHTPRPVLVVPQGKWANSPVLLAYDGSMASMRMLTAGARFAKLFGSTVEVMVSTTDNDHADLLLGEAREYLSPYGLAVNYHHANTSHAADSILERARAYDAQLIAMGAFGSNRLKEWIFGSTTRKILEHLPCPILLSRP